MRNILAGGTLLIIAAVTTLLTPVLQNFMNGIFLSAPVEAPVSQIKIAEPNDPNLHDFYDVDYAKKKLIHHELSALLADKAKTDATRPEVRQIAEQVSLRETQRAGVYAALLTSWNEKYLNLTDFPETGGCSGYPTSSGMLAHKDVGAYRLSSGKTVDTIFFTLLIEHHKKAVDLDTLEGAKIGYGELVKLQAASQAEYNAEISTYEAYQKSTL